MPDCPHARTRNLYDQRPRAEGRKFKAVGRICEDCGAMLPHAETPEESA